MKLVLKLFISQETSSMYRLRYWCYPFCTYQMKQKQQRLWEGEYKI